MPEVTMSDPEKPPAAAIHPNLNGVNAGGPSPDAVLANSGISEPAPPARADTNALGGEEHQQSASTMTLESGAQYGGCINTLTTGPDAMESGSEDGEIVDTPAAARAPATATAPVTKTNPRATVPSKRPASPAGTTYSTPQDSELTGTSMIQAPVSKRTRSNTRRTRPLPTRAQRMFDALFTRPASATGTINGTGGGRPPVSNPVTFGTPSFGPLTLLSFANPTSLAGNETGLSVSESSTRSQSGRLPLKPRGERQPPAVPNPVTFGTSSFRPPTLLSFANSNGLGGPGLTGNETQLGMTESSKRSQSRRPPLETRAEREQVVIKTESEDDSMPPLMPGSTSYSTHRFLPPSVPQGAPLSNTTCGVDVLDFFPRDNLHDSQLDALESVQDRLEHYVCASNPNETFDLATAFPKFAQVPKKKMPHVWEAQVILDRARNQRLFGRSTSKITSSGFQASIDHSAASRSFAIQNSRTHHQASIPFSTKVEGPYSSGSGHPPAPRMAQSPIRAGGDSSLGHVHSSRAHLINGASAPEIPTSEVTRTVSTQSASPQAGAPVQPVAPVRFRTPVQSAPLTQPTTTLPTALAGLTVLTLPRMGVSTAQDTFDLVQNIIREANGLLAAYSNLLIIMWRNHTVDSSKVCEVVYGKLMLAFDLYDRFATVKAMDGATRLPMLYGALLPWHNNDLS
ncbi:hypothetical protein CC80DRAFT_581774 [Byssothecium circinans]|uniref:Uncharacterized protein n=1 Tax=Byssothecium circinans TaxID=147558 RepID=A0A6A5T868_9PLEO|nr:hypothetical protein CC80DRAFT_581774 [Byssothecium circinans]